MALTERWSPAAIRTLLSFVDEQKGVQGFFNSNPKAARIHVAKVLSEKHSSCDDDSYTEAAVAASISRLITAYAKADRLRTPTALYQLGIDILDLAKFPAGTFEQAEIEANRLVDIRSLQLVGRSGKFTPKMHRVLIDVLDENKGTDGLFFKDRHKGCRLIESELKKRISSEQLVEVTIVQIEHKVDYLVQKSISIKKDDNLPYKRRQLFIAGRSILDHRKFEDGVFTQDEIDTWNQNRRESRKRRRVTTESDSEVADTDDESSTQLPVTTPLIAFSGTPLIRNNGLSIVRSSERSVNTESIAPKMSAIFAMMDGAVRKRLAAAGIDPNQPFIINLEQISGDVSELLEGLLFCDRSELPSAIQKLDDVRATRHLPVEVFIQSIIGIAITTWALRPRPQGTDVNVYADVLLSEIRRQGLLTNSSCT